MAQSREQGGLGRGVGMSISGRPAPKATPKPKTVKPKTDASLKKSGLEKLKKLRRTATESDISYAVRHGKITKQEAAALDPKNFKVLLDTSKAKTVGTFDSKTGKFIKGS